MYFHDECLGCESYGIECETGCEYSDDPNRCPHVTPKVYDDISDIQDARAEQEGYFSYEDMMEHYGATIAE